MYLRVNECQHLSCQHVHLYLWISEYQGLPWDYVWISQAEVRKHQVTKFLKVQGEKLLKGKGILTQESGCNKHWLWALHHCISQEAYLEATDGAFFFNWNIVDFKCCVSFWYTSKWFSYTYMCSFSCSFPLCLLQYIEYGSLCCRVGSCCLPSFYKQFVSANPKLLIYPFPIPPFIFENHKFVFYVCKSIL